MTAREQKLLAALEELVALHEIANAVPFHLDAMPLDRVVRAWDTAKTLVAS